MYVNNLIRKLHKENRTVTFENITDIEGLENQTISLEGRLISVDKANYYIITFRSVETAKPNKKKAANVIDVHSEVNSRVVELEKELQTSRENLQATVEELEPPMRNSNQATRN